MRFRSLSLVMAWAAGLSLTAVIATPPATAPATAPAGRYTQQLRRECEAMLTTAIRRPYGWAWPANLAPPPVVDAKAAIKTRPAPPAADLTSPGTAAAGFVLFWAADLLDEPRYREAAFQAARGMGAAQRSTGQIPARPIFLAGGAGGKDEVTLVADRAPTCAALGLILTILDEGGRSQPSLQPSAARAAGWLLKQQAGSGAWPIGYPPAAEPKDATRIVRLDTSDFRNCTLAMLYSYEVLQSRIYRASVERSTDLLLRMRLGNLSKAGAKLWSNGYQLDGLLGDAIQSELLSGIDVLASRYAVQTLFADHLVLGSAASGKAVDEAVTAIEQLPHENGLWTRVYDNGGQPYKLDAQSTPSGNEVFRPTTAPVVPPTMRTGTFGWATLLPAVSEAKADGRAVYERKLAEWFTYKQQLGAVLTGLSDDVMSGILPVRREEVAAYIQLRERDWRLLEGGPPADLAGRTRRLWLLLERAKLEVKFGE